jgi:hypothetical protein
MFSFSIKHSLVQLEACVGIVSCIVCHVQSLPVTREQKNCDCDGICKNAEDSVHIVPLMTHIPLEFLQCSEAGSLVLTQLYTAEPH